MEVRVLFRNADSKLACMMTEVFESVRDAKDEIEFDASFFLDSHNKLSRGLAKQCKPYAKWIKPKTKDYFEVRGRDGASCIYQYFIDK